MTTSLVDNDIAVAHLLDQNMGPRYRAGIDGLDRGRLSGWAVDLVSCQKHLKVTLTIDGLDFMTVIADGPRPDLPGYGGNGNCGFEFWLQQADSALFLAVFSKLLADDALVDEVPEISVSINGGTCRVLTDTTLTRKELAANLVAWAEGTIDPNDPLVTAKMAYLADRINSASPLTKSQITKLLHRRIEGKFIGLDSQVIRGLAHSKDNFGPINVVVVIDSEVSGAALASGPDGAFEYVIPPIHLDGNIHTVDFLDKDTGLPILGSPLSVYFEPIHPAAPEKTEHKKLDGRLSAIAAPAIKGTAPAISVIIPTFNRASELQGTLDIILAQAANGLPLDVIVIDDGSTDDTKTVLDRLKKVHSRLRFRSVPNGGPGQARNVGAEMAEAELVMFLGDDTRPASSDYFKIHYQAHQANPDVDKAVLGKIVWPDSNGMPPNLVMSLIQGDGHQQFSFKSLTPWKWCNWQHFYTSNISIKKKLVTDWKTNGFKKDFYLAAFEDAELAYRMTQAHKDFRILYVPTAVIEHHHPYSLQGFMNRQISCGLMMDVFLKLHPELTEMLLGPSLMSALHTPLDNVAANLPLEHYVAAVEGIKSWGLILDHHVALGWQNWHADFLNSVFRLCVYHGYLMSRANAGENVPLAYRTILEQFRTDLGRAISNEVLGEIAGFPLI